MQRYYEEIQEIDNSTFVVNADDVAIGEMVRVEKQDGTKLYGSVISFDATRVIVQAMGPTKGISTGDRVVFLKKMMGVVVGEHTLGRVLNAMGEPLDGGPKVEGVEVAIGVASANPVNRVMPHRMIQTNIPMIDLFNCLVRSNTLFIS